MASINAIEQRVRKKLMEEGRGRQLCKNTGCALGDYYLADPGLTTGIQPHVDLILLARELGVLKDGEKVEQTGWKGQPYHPL